MKFDAIFLNGPFIPGFSRESRSPAVTKSGTLYYPAWLAYACGYCEESGYRCKLIDSIADSLDIQSTVELVTKDDPSIVFIGTSTPSIDADINTAWQIKSNLPNVKIVLVGTHASALHKEIIEENEFIDFVARREYDLTAKELLDAANGIAEFDNVRGITYKKNGLLVANEDNEYIPDLDILPFASKVYSKNLNIRNYFYGHIRYPMVSIFTSRGCNARCNFCVYPQTMFGNFRERSPENIAAEFKWISENLPEVREVLIDDDTFTMNLSHAKKVANALIEINNKLLWTCEARSTLDYETMLLMKKAGCRLIVTGFESTSQEVLDKINKNIKHNQQDSFVDAAQRAGLKIHACFMAGNPGDTVESLKSSLKWALSKNFDTAQFFPLQVYPGTKAYTDAVDNKTLKQQPFKDWVTVSGMHNMTIIKNDMGISFQECLDFCDYARRKFYLRPSYITQKVIEGLMNPQEFKKNLKGFLKIYRYLFKKVSNETS